MKKIGHISLFYRPLVGGQDTYIENLKQVLEKQGYQNTVYQSLSLRFKIDHKGVRAIPSPPLISRWIPNFNWYYFNLALRAFKPAIKKEDVLIVHYAVHYSAVKYHPRVIVVSHGIEWHRPFDQWDDKIRARRARETFQSNRIVANDTEYLRFCGLNIKPGTRFFEEISPGKWFVPNCVNTEQFAKVPPDPDLKKLNAILVPRNIYRQRGIHLAIAAFGLMVREGNTKNNLVIIGKIIDRQYYLDLLTLIDQSGIKERVFFAGHGGWKDMPSKYSAGVCTVIPTVDCEGTSLSALESMACETPVVATSVAGLKDLPCLLAEPNARSLKEAINQVLENREKFSKDQRETVVRLFNMRNWANAWQTILSKPF